MRWGRWRIVALSGEVPIEATERVQADRLPPVAQVARGRMSARFAATVDAALAVNEADRPQSLEEWRALLDRQPLPVEEEPPEPPQQDEARVVESGTVTGDSGQGSAGRRRLVVVAAAGLAAAALVVGPIFFGPGPVLEENSGIRETVPDPPVPGTNGEPNSGGDVAEPIVDGTRTPESPVPPIVIDPGPVSGPGSPADPVAERPGIADVATPSPEAIEDALGLGAAELRAIQEGLAAAGFDPGGADGLFGAGTRTALRAWQADRGITETGYLTEVSAEELRARERGGPGRAPHGGGCRGSGRGVAGGSGAGLRAVEHGRVFSDSDGSRV